MVHCLHLRMHYCHALTGLDLDLEAELLPLQCPQLTELQLCEGRFSADKILAMVSQLPQLEVLEVLDREDLTELEALPLSCCPNLRTVNLSESLLSAPDRDRPPRRKSRPVSSAERNFIARLMGEAQAAPNSNGVQEELVDDEFGIDDDDDEYGSSDDDEWWS